MGHRNNAVQTFATAGIELVKAKNREFCWTHDGYSKMHPMTKDIEVRIRRGNYMGEVVHRVTLKMVHIDDAASRASEVLDEYVNGWPTNMDSSSFRETSGVQS